MRERRRLERPKDSLSEGPPDHARARDPLRARFRNKGSGALSDRELLQIVLSRTVPGQDVKPLARALIAKFGSFAETISALPQRLAEVEGLGDTTIIELKVIEAAALRLSQGELKQRPVLSLSSSVLKYLHTAMAFAHREQFRVLFLDKRNQLIADEVQQIGTVDHTPVYPREVVKRALELSATSVILVHNHPSGNATASQADVQITRQIVDGGKHFGITVHDHIIIAKTGHTSLRALGLIA
jgi:DNA repair protein RadC